MVLLPYILQPSRYQIRSINDIVQILIPIIF